MRTDAALAGEPAIRCAVGCIDLMNDRLELVIRISVLLLQQLPKRGTRQLERIDPVLKGNKLASVRRSRRNSADRSESSAVHAGVAINAGVIAKEISKHAAFYGMRKVFLRSVRIATAIP